MITPYQQREIMKTLDELRSELLAVVNLRNIKAISQAEFLDRFKKLDSLIAARERSAKLNASVEKLSATTSC